VLVGVVSAVAADLDPAPDARGLGVGAAAGASTGSVVGAGRATAAGAERPVGAGTVGDAGDWAAAAAGEGPGGRRKTVSAAVTPNASPEAIIVTTIHGTGLRLAVGGREAGTDARAAAATDDAVSPGENGSGAIDGIGAAA
jgi:hypothetical protein